MTPLIVPTFDVNSERVFVRALHAKNESEVAQGDIIAEVETSKAVFELEASESGYLRYSCALDDELAPGAVYAHVFPSLEALRAFRPDAEQTPVTGRATRPAEELAKKLGVDLTSIQKEGLITAADVRSAAAASAPLQSPLHIDATEQFMERVMIIGAGRGAEQVMDIFAQDSRQRAVGILDDDPKHWSRTIDGVPVVGGVDRLAELSEHYDRVIIAVSKSTRARRILREKVEAAGATLTNAIDATSKIATHVTLGVGNVICAFCQVGTKTELGDNNFLSAYNSVEHHNVWGRDISTGPGCMSSSRVRLGDGVRLGTGIFIQPGVELGERVAVASGAVLVDSVPARHTVKTKVITTIVVPPRD